MPEEFSALAVTPQIAIDLSEIEFTAIRAQGAGGQNVNKVSSAIHLRFDIPSSSLCEEIKQRLLASNDKRVNKDGVFILKAQKYRTQEANRQDALERLAEVVRAAAAVQKRRLPSRPKLSAKKKRVDTKTQRGKLKSLRSKVSW